ncbi:arginine N-succinyltransferase [Motiliproteus sp. MSK22-1]|uniref:arginine N-succinyltransferase n=1 Tax=Motiliproteus sp. MSK22-1 TaxID=1897630 RepID=UPI0009758C01|nr:arginine N-succinyltransferase [Motiliproteus sp. MSK22-1]OMH30087.1 arginine N-succinyltransferase [Motiliproteus sp. MSK22-1]
MLIFRPLNYADIQDLERLAVVSGGSMTTLPANRDHLSELIGQTQQSLRKEVERGEQESYHFVLEDTDSNRIVGVSGIDAAVGLGSPFYSYRIDEVVHASAEMQIHNRIPALHLCQDYTGASRFCTLFLDKDWRSLENLHLLSRARMLFMAQNPERFSPRTLAELQGPVDEDNRSPFWECLGKHFFSMDFAKANYLTGINSKSFVADLMPHYPVYVPLLSEEAQRALGQPRPDVEDIMCLLESEGFKYRGYVDIFDGGPTIEARTEDIRSISDSRLTQVRIAATGAKDTDNNRPWIMISNTKLLDYRCLMLQLDPKDPQLSPEQAAQLLVTDSDQVRLLALDPRELGHK